MEEKKQKSNVLALVILGVVAIFLCFIVWNLEKKVDRLDNENRQLQQQINANIKTPAPAEIPTEETPVEETPTEVVPGE